MLGVMWLHWANLNRPQTTHLELNSAAEIIGKVKEDLSVQVLQATNFGPGIGMSCPNSSHVLILRHHPMLSCRRSKCFWIVPHAGAVITDGGWRGM